MKPTPSMAVAMTALLVALGGTAAGASHLLNGSKISKASIPGNRLKKDSVTGTQVKESSLGTVPSAANATHAVSAANATHAVSADSATSAGGAPPTGAAGGALSGSYPNPSLAPAEGWHEVGASGEPPFRSNCGNVGFQHETVAFYKDPVGVVHLKGTYSCTLGAYGNIVFQLPPGDRPASNLTLTLPIACDCKIGANSVSTGNIVIRGSGFASTADGGVELLTQEGTPGQSYISLDGVSFRADG